MSRDTLHHEIRWNVGFSPSSDPFRTRVIPPTAFGDQRIGKFCDNMLKPQVLEKLVHRTPLRVYLKSM
jgi:hypothetical protein